MSASAIRRRPHLHPSFVTKCCPCMLAIVIIVAPGHAHHTVFFMRHRLTISVARTFSSSPSPTFTTSCHRQCPHVLVVVASWHPATPCSCGIHQFNSHFFACPQLSPSYLRLYHKAPIFYRIRPPPHQVTPSYGPCPPVIKGTWYATITSWPFAHTRLTFLR